MLGLGVIHQCYEGLDYCQEKDKASGLEQIQEGQEAANLRGKTLTSTVTYSQMRFLTQSNFLLIQICYHQNSNYLFFYIVIRRKGWMTNSQL